MFNELDAFDELGLHELSGGDRLAKLNTLLGVLEGSLASPSGHTRGKPSHEDSRVLEDFFSSGGEVFSKFKSLIIRDEVIIEDNVCILD